MVIFLTIIFLPPLGFPVELKIGPSIVAGIASVGKLVRYHLNFTFTTTTAATGVSLFTVWNIASVAVKEHRIRKGTVEFKCRRCNE